MGSTSNNSPSKTKLPSNFVAWFEIPATNFDQAVAFYNQIYDMEMETYESDTHTMAFFANETGISGAIVSGPGSNPSESGPLLYLNAGDDLNEVLSKIEPAGGRVIMPKTLINEESGYFALFIDSEGNKLALHSKN